MMRFQQALKLIQNLQKDILPDKKQETERHWKKSKICKKSSEKSKERGTSVINLWKKNNSRLKEEAASIEAQQKLTL